MVGEPAGPAFRRTLGPAAGGAGPPTAWFPPCSLSGEESLRPISLLDAPTPRCCSLATESPALLVVETKGYRWWGPGLTTSQVAPNWQGAGLEPGGGGPPGLGAPRADCARLGAGEVGFLGGLRPEHTPIPVPVRCPAGQVGVPCTPSHGREGALGSPAPLPRFSRSWKCLPWPQSSQSPGVLVRTAPTRPGP